MSGREPVKVKASRQNNRTLTEPRPSTRKFLFPQIILLRGAVGFDSSLEFRQALTFGYVSQPYFRLVGFDSSLDLRKLIYTRDKSSRQ